MRPVFEALAQCASVGFTFVRDAWLIFRRSSWPEANGKCLVAINPTISSQKSFGSISISFCRQYACYLEECEHKSQTPAERHDHCITQHKFPHDFRFDGFNHKKAMINSIKQCNSQSNNINRDADKKPTTSSIVQASKFAANQVQDEDIVLEDKSILLMAQRKPITSFSFGHRKAKTFSSATDTADGRSYAKALTQKSKQPKRSSASSTLECEKMIEDLIDSLPQ